MSIFGLPLILFKVVGAVAAEDMSDIQYLAIKEFEGKVRTDENTINNVTGVTATLTANVGKDMYLAKASITLSSNSANSDNDVTGALRVNGVDIEPFKLTIVPENQSKTFKFSTVGLMVPAGQVIDINIALIEFVQINAFLECWEEDTGESPQIPPLNPV